MYITTEVLCFELEKKWPITSIYLTDSLSLHPPLFLEEKTIFEPNHIYIVGLKLAKQLNLTKSLFIINDPDLLEYYKSWQVNIIYINEKIENSRLFNMLQLIFNKYSEWNNKLQMLKHDKASIQQLLNMCSQFMGCELAVTDDNLNFIAVSNKGQPVVDAKFDDFTKAAPFKILERASQQLEDRFYQLNINELIDKDYPQLLFYTQIGDDETILGNFSMQNLDRPLAKHDYHLFKYVYYFVQQHLYMPVTNEESHYMSLLSSLDKGEDIPAYDFEKLLVLAKYEVGHQFECAVISLPKHAPLQYGGFIKVKLQMNFPNALIVMQDEHIVCITCHATPIWHCESSFQKVEECFGSIHFLVGVSNPFLQLNELPIYKVEAFEALSYSSAIKRIQLFKDIWPSVVIDQASRLLPKENFYLAGFKHVIDYNNQSNVDYIDTLKIWIEEGLNDSRTASRLFISRNSFLSRRDRLIELLGSSLTSSEERYQIYLNIQMHLHTNSDRT